MKKQHLQPQKASKKNGYSITELVITSLIIGTLSSIAYPNYVNSNNNSKLADAKSSVLSIPSIIGAYIDSTGESPKTWEDLSTIAVVMTNNGPATGELTTPITLPNSIYDLSVEGPTESVYTLTATRVSDKNNNNPGQKQYQYAIKSCFDVSNGASDLRTGTLADIENELNCG
jgi:Tfp pilus assembly protein PilE